MQHSSSSNHHQQPPQESSSSSPTTTSSQFSYPYHSQQQQQQQQQQQSYQQQTQPQSQPQRHIIKQTTISQQQPQQPHDMMYQPQPQQQQQQQSISSSSSSSSSSYQRMASQHHHSPPPPPPPLQHHNYQHYPSTNAPQARMESLSSSQQQQQQQQPPPPQQQMVHAPATHTSPLNVNSPSVTATIPKKGPSCHHCRQSHIGCDGNRPCQNCVRKNKICFDYDKKLIRKSVGGGGGGGASSSTPGATKSKVPPPSTSTPPPPTTSSSSATTPTPTTVNEQVYHRSNNNNNNNNNSNIGSFHYVENTMDNNNNQGQNMGSGNISHNNSSSSNHQFHAIQMMEHEMESIREQLNKRDEQMKDLAVQNQFLMKVVNELKELDNHHHHQKQSPSLLGSSSTSTSNVSKTSSGSNNDDFYMFHTPQQHEYSLMVWEPPQELLRPCYMFDTVTFRIIGCNRAFCEMTGYSVEQLKRTSLFSLLPERLREPWKVLLQWAAYSSIQTLDGTGIVLFSGNREKCVKVRRVIEKNFMRVEYEPTTIFTDSFVVDGIQIPETFRIMYNEVLHQNMLAIPTTSYQRLLDLFVKLKSLRETHYTSLPESLGNVHRPSPSASPQQPQSQQQYSQSQQSQQPQTQQQVQQTGRSSSDSNGEQGYSNTSCNSMSNNANSSSAHGASGSSLGYQATVHPPEYEFQQLADKYGAKIYSQMIADQQQQSSAQVIQPRYSATQPVTYTYTHTPSGTVISLPHSMETFSISMANDQSVPIVRPALPSHVFLGKPT